MKNLLIWLIFIVVVMVAIWVIPIALSFTMAVDEPMMTVTSHSMWPTLKRGDLIFIKSIEPEDIDVGKLIVFRHGEGMAVHRVVRVDTWTITTKGDANLKEDLPITSWDVVGYVPTIGETPVKIPFIGNIGFFLNPETEVSQAGQPAPEPGGLLAVLGRYLGNPLGFSLLVLLPAVMIFSSGFGDIMCKINPRMKRARHRRNRAARFEKRWGRDRARRALRVESGFMTLIK